MLSIFFVFKPLDIKALPFKEVPVFEFKNFTMYELDTQGLKTKVSGKSAAKYEDRYVIKDVNYLDNTTKNKASMVAKDAVFNEEKHMVYLNNKVVYTSLQKNSFRFETTHATYNTRNGIVISDAPYHVVFNGGTMQGTYLMYDTKNEKIFSKKVSAYYNFK